MCIRCNNADASEPLGLCPVCAVQTRLEFGRGLRRLGDYLAAWAAFDAWLRDHDREPAVAR
jgi:hypothetical protein